MFEYHAGKADFAKFMKARQKFIIYVGERYEHMAKIFEDGVDVNPDDYKPRYPTKPIDPQPIDHDDDVPDNERQRLDLIVERQIEFNKMQYREDIQIYERELTEYVKSMSRHKSNLKMVYYLLLNHISRSLKDALEQDAPWESIHDRKDVVQLWLLIYSLCVTGAALEVNESKREVDAHNKFGRVRQNRNEDLSVFYQRFKLECEALEAVTGEELSQSMRAIYFIEKLDKRKYQKLIDDLNNSSAMGRDEYPLSLSSAFDMVCRYKVNGVHLSSDQLISASSFYASDKKHNKINEQKGKSVKKDDDNRFNQKAKPKSGKCHFCDQEGHWVRECSLLKKAKSLSTKIMRRHRV